MDDSYLLISPCRNEAEFMVKTLDSVVSQSLRPAKWIIVDDGSTDATPDILRQYSESTTLSKSSPAITAVTAVLGLGLLRLFMRVWTRLI